MTLILDDELTGQIQAIATARQESPDAYVRRAVENMLRQDEDARPDEYDPDNWKGSSMAQSIEKMRSKYGLPDDWGTKPLELTEQDWADIDAAQAQIYSDTLSNK